ncbi:hypothetical protein AUEXF2481DRAFT_7362 [Aureobasidium subglaciale EXF-2481]|uniref:Uncharacterized protein n=1 Tax=Aureobasidium subglaciale (strain EXF-2481) TaxID=1043005 RepID=A0A074Y4J6_AURSE|nr:uncharacterized protein AUEXF2481DRAFT_7362 [Aureobasidium subglaciale EXF-2481]KAI5210852.1 hypothetical protein E4T38_01857 [Aureobasidium subglaciale]KAI5229332.1 hypothetical protein E4T40_01622 [Aureobasidium subglaciale]KAI5232886.1 hypothetical protein E4T41_01855 [Aureobasidium subglaciale]KAI5266253.1 hypothetical protein E4T46_01619 [Aureobasidium subglaciale]KEQ92605.1 hypothetical protein AUEXF2481DRAFT_7362 [Aureobasidium subglaciale EXF-2481]
MVGVRLTSHTPPGQTSSTAPIPPPNFGTGLPHTAQSVLALSLSVALRPLVPLLSRLMQPVLPPTGAGGAAPQQIQRPGAWPQTRLVGMAGYAGGLRVIVAPVPMPFDPTGPPTLAVSAGQDNRARMRHRVTSSSYTDQRTAGTISVMATRSAGMRCLLPPVFGGPAAPLVPPETRSPTLTDLVSPCGAGLRAIPPIR